jgi:methyl-accepting chemotaxis protein
MSIADRFYQMLKDRMETTRPARSHSGFDGALLFNSHDVATRSTQSATSTCQTAGATAAQQRGALDAASDHARLLVARGRDLRATAQQVRESLERAKLVALNAGLEGSRLGEPVGKAMVAIADEMRSLVGRGLEALEEHLTLLSQVDRERDKLQEQVEHAGQRAGSLAEELLRSQAALREASAALAKLGEGLQRSTGADPQMARAVSSAAEHARGLLAALSTLSGHSQRGLMWRALAPTIKPLLRLLRDLDQGARAQNGSG